MSFFFFWKVQDLMLDDCGQKNIRVYTNIHMCWRTHVSGFSEGGGGLFHANPILQIEKQASVFRCGVCSAIA